MPFALLSSPYLLALLLVPAWGLAALILLVGGAPGEWARMALTAWTALAATLLAGGAVAGGAPPLALLVPAAGFVALMTGGPWGLLVVAAAAAVLPLLPAEGPRWPAAVLALAPAAVALRQILWR